MDDVLPVPAEEATSPATETTTIASGEISHVIIRGCSRCASQRTLDEPCAGCGNPEPPEVTDLGIVSAIYRNPLKRAWWTAVRAPLASRRIRDAGRRTLELRAKGD